MDQQQESEGVFTEVMRRIEQAPIILEPFPHIYIPGIFPEAYYHSLLARIDAVGNFVPTLYPGVGVDLKAQNFKDHGLTCENFEQDAQLLPLHRFLKSERFTEALLKKFSAPGSWGPRGSAIPPGKHIYFRNACHNYASVFDLHRDLAGYEISPHPDVPSKILTFLFYLTPSDELRQFGTLLCKPKPGIQLKLAGAGRSPLMARLVHSLKSLVGGRYGLAQKDEWFPWESFDIAKVAEARANTLLVFSPNADSYHAVRLNIPADHPLQQRQTLRGFVRAGHNSTNYKSPNSRGGLRTLLFRLVRASGLGR